MTTSLSPAAKTKISFPCKASQEITEVVVLTTKANREGTKELQMHVHTHPSTVHPSVHVLQQPPMAQLPLKESLLTWSENG